jgi:hypothetical protein
VSGQVHDVGSITGFWPDDTGPASGTALVVTERSGWSVRTELRRVVLVAGRYVAGNQPDPAHVQDASLPDPAAVSTPGSVGHGYHWGRAWSPSDIEALCPCPKAPCGYVIQGKESPDCDQHAERFHLALDRHRADRCPDRP